MAKYLIQDIIPANRKHSSKPTEKVVTERSTLINSEPTPIAPPAPIVPEVKNEARAIEHPIQATISHALHHDQQASDEQNTNEIHDELLERPQSMIIENLYHGGDAKNDSETIKEPPVVNMDGGTYPYNTTEKEYRAPVNKPSWKFPETSNFANMLGGWVPWVVVPIVILVAGVLLMNHFAGATVLLIPKHDTLPIPQNEQFSAMKNPNDGVLGFSVMKLSLDDSAEVSATGTKTVTAKASGKIVIYNEQTAVQRLIKNTRFESTAGKIYRINESIDVPKAVTKSGKTLPGKIEMTVYADEAGPDFNSDPTDFTIPGLKKTPQATKVYGRSNGPVTGGASGTIKSVSDTELKQASENLRVSLETKLRSKARGDLAPNQIAYDQGIVVTLGDPALSNQAASSGDKAVVTETGTLYMVVFDRQMLTKYIAKALVPTYSGENIEMTNIDSLTMTMPAMKGDTLATLDKLDFSLSGTPSLIWQIDEDKIKKELIGVQKSNFNLILGQYTNIERAKASIQPIWKSTFPESEKSITVKLVSEIAN